VIRDRRQLAIGALEIHTDHSLFLGRDSVQSYDEEVDATVAIELGESRGDAPPAALEGSHREEIFGSRSAGSGK
jgi:hypothetical protein